MAADDRRNRGRTTDERIAELARILERRARSLQCSDCGRPAMASSLDTATGEVRHYCEDCLNAGKEEPI